MGGGGERHEGVLKEWNDARGFGFIEPPDGGAGVFVHISAFPRGRRPASGRKVSYVLGQDELKRPRALQVTYVGRQPAGAPGLGPIASALTVVSLFVAVLLGLLLLGEVPSALLAAYAVLSGVALIMYRVDKVAAVNGQWRTSEATLHVIALLGGWPGALVARRVFRHKTTKEPFRSIFWCTVVANCVALAGFVLDVPIAELWSE
ncbi:cold shock and DUF1294 domain-containing protein [Pedococcus sp. KACC 23699]|uniref:Cold shock and DUF1294 domain-containing protein n=1 Tax=Pedococcus sp. KACC 23699 TaxID=3149228 RepID=A0AAU7JWJ5_9MICO